MLAPTAVDVAFAHERSNQAFYMMAVMSAAGLAIGSALIWSRPFSGCQVVGVSMISSIIGLWTKTPTHNSNGHHPPAAGDDQV